MNRPDLLLQGGEVVDEEGPRRADLLVRDGHIARRGKGIKDPRARVIDASGMYVLPGLVDMHTHLREPGDERSETIETGCKAAAAGGYTAIVCMPNTYPPIDSCEMVRSIKSKAREVGLVDVEVAACVTEGRKGRRITEMGLLAEEGVRLFTDDGTCVRSANVLRLALLNSARMGFVVADHPEDPTLVGEDIEDIEVDEGEPKDSNATSRRPGIPGCVNEGKLSSKLGLPGRPREAEVVVVARDLCILKATGGNLHLQHLTTSDSIGLVRQAKQEGLCVTAEVTPHHLVFTEDAVGSYDPIFKVNPPLRPSNDVEALREALADGVIDVIATDHAPHAPELKELTLEEAPAGIAGIEVALSLLYTELVLERIVTIADLVRFMSCNPARILSLSEQGKPLKEGAPANLAIFDPARTWEFDPSRSQSKAKLTPYAGRKLTGKVLYTVARGKLVFEQERSDI